MGILEEQAKLKEEIASIEREILKVAKKNEELAVDQYLIKKARSNCVERNKRLGHKLAELVKKLADPVTTIRIGGK